MRRVPAVKVLLTRWKNHYRFWANKLLIYGYPFSLIAHLLAEFKMLKGISRGCSFKGCDRWFLRIAIFPFSRLIAQALLFYGRLNYSKKSGYRNNQDIFFGYSKVAIRKIERCKI